MSKLKYKSIMQKMISGFSIVILFTVLISSVSVVTAVQSNRQTKTIMDENLHALIHLQHLNQMFTEKNALANEYLVTHNGDRVDEFIQLSKESEQMEEELLEQYDTSDIRLVIAENVAWSDSVRTLVFKQVEMNNQEIAENNMGSLKARGDQLVASYKQISASYEEEIMEVGQQLTTSQNSAIIFVISLSVLVIILSGFVAWNTSKSISLPVGLMKERLEEIASENFSSKPFTVTTADEIGALAIALNTMQAYLFNLMNSIKNTADLISQNSYELNEAGKEVQNGTNQITATMQELATGTEQQANSASTLSEGMISFAQKIDETTKNGEFIARSSQKIMNKANEGTKLMASSNTQMTIIDDIVKESVHQMESLSKQTNEISKLVDIVKSIAEQTNLLALNASIEAARAGEQGRGFAVVADEVRKLAEEVDASVTQITDYVSNVQKDAKIVSNSLEDVTNEVGTGSLHIRATDEKLTEITQAISNLQQQNLEMKTHLEDISDRSAEINVQITDIAAVSEESAAGVEETSASVEEINYSMDEIAIKTEKLEEVTEGLNNLVHNVTV